MSDMHYTFWLLPVEPLKSVLRECIDRLADEFQAPKFEPHVTVYHGPCNQKEAEGIVEKLSQQFSSFELELEKLNQSSLYAKTFYLQFKPSFKLLKMSEVIQNAVAQPVTPYNLNPHLSLLYKDLSENQREELCQRELLANEAYLFNTLCAVAFQSPWTEQSAQSYQIISEKALLSRP